MGRKKGMHTKNWGNGRETTTPQDNVCRDRKSSLSEVTMNRAMQGTAYTAPQFYVGEGQNVNSK